MKPKSLSHALALLCGTSTIALADTIVTGDVTTNLGPAFFLDAASTGGGDFAINEPGTVSFDRSFGTLNIGTGGSTISVTGIGWATLNNAGANDATSATVTITYLGADGVFGGGDDVLIGTATDNFTFAANGEYYWKFTSPISNVIDGTNNLFRVAITPINGTTSGSLSFKTSATNPNGNASNVKLSVAGTSVIVGSPLVDSDMDGIIDAFETNTGIYVSPVNTGTNPNDNDTDDDGLLDGVETNTGVWVSASNTGTSPFKNDTDNDTLLDGVETNTGTFTSASETGTNPHNRDTDGDRLGDAYEVTNGLNPHANADFDNDTFSDALEVLFYGSDPKLGTSFPGDGISPAPGTFTPILDGGVTTSGSLDIPNTLGAAILNEAGFGGDFDGNFSNGVTNFVLSFEDLFPAAGSTVSLTGFAWQVVAGTNASGDILLQFFDPGADGVVDGIDKDTLVGTAKGTLTVTGSSTVMYWNFSSPVNFTSAGTGLMIKIQSTAALRIKAQDNFASGVWYANDGLSTFGTNRSSRVSIGGTAIAPSSSYSGWKTANNTTGTLDEDHDNDGVSNGVEYFLEGETDTTGFTPLPGVTNNSVTWTKAASGYSGAYGTDFEVETSTTLAGAWTPVTEGVGQGFVEITGNDVKYTFPAGPKNFVRLKVTGP